MSVAMFFRGFERTHVEDVIPFFFRPQILDRLGTKGLIHSPIDEPHLAGIDLVELKQVIARVVAVGNHPRRALRETWNGNVIGGMKKVTVPLRVHYEAEVVNVNDGSGAIEKRSHVRR